MKEEFDGWENFVNDMRSYLQVEGKDPFLIAGCLDWHALDPGFEDHPNRRALSTQFDATTTWIHPEIVNRRYKGKTVPWDETLEWTEKTYRNTREFSENHGMEFMPMIFPGFDDRGNTCWGGDRHIPRSVDKFEKMLELADKYRTTDRIEIATWNDWAEGHQIEPGTFRGNDYGTAYLNSIEEFQRGNGG